MAPPRKPPRSPLHAARLDRNLTLQQAVDGVLALFKAENDHHRGLNVQMLCAYERGERPGWDYAIKLCQFYEATAEQLGFLPDYSRAEADRPNSSGDMSMEGSSQPVDGKSETDPSAWSWKDRHGDGPASSGVADPRVSAEGKDDVNRLKFLTTMLAGGASALLPRAEPRHAPVRLGPADVARWQERLTRLYQLDDQYGGDAGVYDLTLQTLRQIFYSLRYDRYGEATGRALHLVSGQVTEHAGWLAYDSGRHAEARYWWLEALHSARLAEDDRIAVVVLASMSLQASSTSRPHEARDLAQAAHRAVKPHTTPRLRSVLLAREALGHAGIGDGPATRRALAGAVKALEGGCCDDDPTWLSFWDHADLAWHERQAASSLRNADGAERAARLALTAVDPATYPRNHALYLGGLAEILIARGEFDEAIPMAARVVTEAGHLDSGRLNAQAHALVENLTPHDQEPSIRQFREWASQALATASMP